MLQTTQEYIDIITSALTKGSDITTKPGKAWKVDMSKKELEYKDSDLRQLHPLITKGLLVHEIGHLLHTDITAEEEEKRENIKKYKNNMHTAYNAFEDMRIERLQVDRFGAFASVSLNACNIHSFSRYEKEENREKTREMSKLFQFLVGTMALYSHYWNRDFRAHIDCNRVLDNLLPEVRTRIMTIPNLPDKLHDIAGRATTKDGMDYVDSEIVPHIQDYLEENKDTAKKEDIKEGSSKSQEGEPTKTKSKTEKYLERQEELTPITEQEAKALLAPYIRTLAQRLNDILKEMKATRYTGAHKQGKLLSKNAYKVLTGEERIFNKKTVPNVPYYNVYIGLDRSGSMSMDRIKYSFISGVLLQEVCKILNFPVHLYTYHTYTDPISNIDEYKIGGDDNCEWTLFDAVAEDIKKRKTDTEENLLFVITDGGTNRTEKFVTGEKNLKNANCQLIGIGVGDPSIKHCIEQVYKSGVYTTTPQELPLKVIGLLKTIIHR